MATVARKRTRSGRRIMGTVDIVLLWSRFIPALITYARVMAGAVCGVGAEGGGRRSEGRDACRVRWPSFACEKRS